MKAVFKVGDHVNIHLSTGDRIDGKVVSVTEEFVELLQPKAYREEQPTVIVMRKSEEWGLPRHRNIIKYKGPDTRGAFLTDKARRKIEKRLGL